MPLFNVLTEVIVGLQEFFSLDFFCLLMKLMKEWTILKQF